MCARFETDQHAVAKPGDVVRAVGPRGWVAHPWAGFARGEILGWWRKQGAEPLDIWAARFAEKADDTGELLWDEVPGGLVIRAVLDVRAKPLVKVVTRAATAAEMTRFRHPRMPVLEPPLHGPHPGPQGAPGHA